MVEQTIYSEISEKKTSKIGYLILIALFIFLIIIGQKVFSDIEYVPDEPRTPSDCVALQRLEFKSRIDYCYFSEIDKKFQLDTQYENIEDEINEIVSINKDVNDKESQIRSNKITISDLLRKYDISLQETIANEYALLDKPDIKSQLISLQEYEDHLNQEITQLTASRKSIIKNIDPEVQIDYAGQARLFFQTGGQMAGTFIFALIFIFLVLAAQFESFRDPFIVLFTIPLSIFVKVSKNIRTNQRCLFKALQRVNA